MKELDEIKANRSVLTRRSKSIVFAVCAFVAQYLLSYLLYPYEDWWDDYKNSDPLQTASEFVFNGLFSTLISQVVLFTNHQLNKVLPWVDRPVRRLVIETSTNIVSVHLILFLELSILFLTDDYSTEPYTREDVVFLTNWIVCGVIISLLISAIQTGEYLIVNWRNSIFEMAELKIKAAEHKQIAAEATLQAAKLQLDPHFVFNNLSVLSELILEDQQLGYQFSENFSRVYRYLLASASKNLIELSEEIRFLNAYIFLLQNRAGDGLKFTIDIPEELNHRKVPPMTLQLLIENAIKHNKFSKENPLMIDVYSTEDENISVKNNIMPLDRKQPSCGIGLVNIVDRYRLLSDKTPVISNDNESFIVKIPLL